MFLRQEDVDLEPANRLLLLPISDCGAGLEVLGEHDDIFFLRKYALFLRKVKYPT